MRRFLAFLSLVISIMWLINAQQAQARGVSLVYFSAEYNADHAETQLVWQTATEIDTLGYYVVRATQRTLAMQAIETLLGAWPSWLPFTSLEFDGDEVMFIPSTGSATSGSVYVAIDLGPESGFADGDVYHYLLVAHTSSGNLRPVNHSEAFVPTVIIGEQLIFLPTIIR